MAALRDQLGSNQIQMQMNCATSGAGGGAGAAFGAGGAGVGAGLAVHRLRVSELKLAGIGLALMNFVKNLFTLSNVMISTMLELW